MTKRLAGLATVAAAVTAAIGVMGGPASAQLSQQPFASYGTGSAVSLSAVQTGTSQLVDVQAAFAGQAANSTGLGGTISNELGFAVQPSSVAGRNAYGRGAGLEVGLGVPLSNAQNQLILSGIAEAAAPPPSGTVVTQIGPVDLGGVANVNLLRGRARATYDPAVCAIGRPLSFGEGEAAGLQLLGTPNAQSGQLDGALVGAALGPTSNDPRNVSRSRTLSYLIPNGDGTFGLVSEVRQTVAPISLLGGAATLELLGEWALRAIATGKPGGARIEYAAVGAGPTTTVARLTLLNAIPLDLSFQDIFGGSGLSLPVPPLATVGIGTPPHAIGGAGAPLVAADGTRAAAAVDAVLLNLLDLGILNLNVADLRIGHMEAAAAVPAGGVRCNLPVSKSVTPNPVVAGNDATVTIRIPSDSAQFAALFNCDLIGVRAQDVHGVFSGDPSFQIVSASNSGVISPDGTTVTWSNLGNVALGAPPLELRVVVRIPANSKAGVLTDRANVEAQLGNCRGGDDGLDIVGERINALGVGNSLTVGQITLVGPEVRQGGGGRIPETGGNAFPLVAGGGLLLAGLALRRRLLV